MMLQSAANEPDTEWIDIREPTDLSEPEIVCQRETVSVWLGTSLVSQRHMSGSGATSAYNDSRRECYIRVFYTATLGSQHSLMLWLHIYNRQQFTTRSMPTDDENTNKGMHTMSNILNMWVVYMWSYPQSGAGHHLVSGSVTNTFRTINSSYLSI